MSTQFIVIYDTSISENYQVYKLLNNSLYFSNIIKNFSIIGKNQFSVDDFLFIVYLMCPFQQHILVLLVCYARIVRSNENK